MYLRTLSEVSKFSPLLPTGGITQASGLVAIPTRKDEAIVRYGMYTNGCRYYDTNLQRAMRQYTYIVT
eukprot:4528692-Pleurochrysis_carterae.AAC.1